MPLIGEIRMWAGTVEAARLLEKDTAGWFICDGKTVNRTTSPDGPRTELFQVIGIIYGGGDGAQSYNLPSFLDKSPMGTSGDAKVPGGPPSGIPGSGGDRAPRTTVSGPATLHGGTPKHILALAEMPAHQHHVYPHAGYIVGSTGVAGAGSEDPNESSQVVTGETTMAGEGVAHNNLHPYQCATFIVYAGAGTRRLT